MITAAAIAGTTAVGRFVRSVVRHRVFNLRVAVSSAMIAVNAAEAGPRKAAARTLTMNDADIDGASLSPTTRIPAPTAAIPRMTLSPFTWSGGSRTTTYTL